MAQVYSTYEAKARFSEILRKVRAGQRIIISSRGEEVAEIRPITDSAPALKEHFRRLEERGVLEAGASRPGKLRPVVRKRGALARFLESRD
jgi:prevent-host-death family protein